MRGDTSEAAVRKSWGAGGAGTLTVSLDTTRTEEPAMSPDPSRRLHRTPAEIVTRRRQWAQPTPTMRHASEEHQATATTPARIVIGANRRS